MGDDVDIEQLSAAMGLPKEDVEKVVEEAQVEGAEPSGDGGEDVVEATPPAPEDPGQKPAVKKPSLRQELVDTRAEAKAFKEQLASREAEFEAFKAEARRREEQMVALFEKSQQKTAPKADEKPALPSLEESPVDHLVARIRQLEEHGTAISQRLETDQRQAAYANHIQSDIDEFSKTAPDFPKAFEHLAGHIDRLYTASGVQDAKERWRLVAQQISGVTAREVSQGRSASEALYRMAREIGYKPQGFDAKTDIERIANGQAETSGLPSGDRGNKKELTFENIADMPIDELSSLLQKDFGGDWAKLMRRLTA